MADTWEDPEIISFSPTSRLKCSVYHAESGLWIGFWPDASILLEASTFLEVIEELHSTISNYILRSVERDDVDKTLLSLNIQLKSADERILLKSRPSSTLYFDIPFDVTIVDTFGELK